jgi:hypothetical protein
MTELERFAAVLLNHWQQESGQPAAPLAVGSLLDRTLPYRTARRELGIETSEDYETLVLRLVAGDGGLARTEPPEAGEMARTTLASKVPDLDVLRLLRSATVTFTDDAIAQLEGVRPLPPRPEEPSPPLIAVEASAEPATPTPVIPLHRAEPVPEPMPEPEPQPDLPPAPTEPAPAFLTGVAFTPPSQRCWQCEQPLPAGREVKFCVECGADQRTPACSQCGAAVERGWRFCPECGTTLRLP